jgi:hypothetical protein
VKRNVFLYGCFQDGTRESGVSTDINFGDLLIYELIKRELTLNGFFVDFLLPDEVSKIESLSKDDFLVIGGGGLIHPNCLNASAINNCLADKSVFGIGINWELDTPNDEIQNLHDNCSFLKSLDFIAVRDCQTKEFIGASHAMVFPDVVLSQWVGERAIAGEKKAMICAPTLTPENGEERICFNSVLFEPGCRKATSIKDFYEFGIVRTSAYHGMLLALSVNATAFVTVHNVKQTAFFESFKDRLCIQETDNYLAVSGKDMAWLSNEATRGVEGLVRYLRSKV